MKTLDDARNLFSLFHDGTITQLRLDNGICDLKLDIEYLAERLDPNFTAFRVKLFSFRSFCFTPWEESVGSPSPTICDPDEIAAAELGILSAEIDGPKIKVACTQDLHPNLGYSGGFLTFECSHAELFDEVGRPVSIDTLKQISTAYWDAFSERRNG